MNVISCPNERQYYIYLHWGEYLQVCPIFLQSPTTELPRQAAHGSVPYEHICPADLGEKEGNSTMQERIYKGRKWNKAFNRILRRGAGRGGEK